MLEKIKNSYSFPLITIGLFAFFFFFDYWIGPWFALLRATLSISVFLFVILTNSLVLIPKLFIERRNKLFYVISLIFLYIISIKAYLAISEFIFPYLDQESFFQEYEYLREKLSGKLEYQWIYPFGFGSVFILMSIMISTVLTVSKYDEERKEKEMVLREEKMQAELKFLRSQINPHFLFNALNNIYTMSYMQMPQAPDNIAKLSEMLRYLLYDCNEDRVELSKEISYLHNYIDFQNLKTEGEQNIQFDIDIKNPSRLLSPVLLEPFVENAFKYSKLEEHNDGFVNLHLKEDHKELIFEVHNSISPEVIPNNDPSRGGIGIENVKKRLSLIYKNQHTLDIVNDGDEFKIILKISFQ
ncbi:sensor histidine kinase [Flammeovirga agarivorans]|uniref:Histidine kinase n=1 Tax=Flammeovirga agarivorans TaxID=2726742 RepID=A0A7X8SPQ4_9BACT|nr:histidine kinase [Flammeovirga agarivorans]NLR94123.1 histidine kinase [Flammeovirga agarivorans]